MARFAIRVLAVFLVLAAAAVAVGVWAYGQYHTPGPHPSEVTVIIEPGTGVEGIANRLTAAGALERPLIFRFGVRLTGVGKRLQAGEYAVPARASPRDIADLLISGRTVVHRLTVVEGATAFEVLRLLRENEALSGDVAGPVAEGSLLPETYHFSRGHKRAALLDRMQADMRATVERLWRERDPDTPLASPEEALTLASIVEKETGLAAERPRIAAVFLNRLRRGMRLQSDPTVLYAMTNGETVLDRPLLRSDLALDSPYNTYVAKGLPPGPICNPGVASIAAVLRPAVTKELYFVADGTGGHAFASTLDEHNRNVRKWRQRRREEETAKP